MPDQSAWKPGQILSERAADIRDGYRVVHRSVVNPPGHWEGVGHFTYVFFRDDELCQCTPDEVALSPDGKYALYINTMSGRLMLFDAARIRATPITDEYRGAPYSADWDMVRRNVTAHLSRPDNGEKVDLSIDLRE